MTQHWLVSLTTPSSLLNTFLSLLFTGRPPRQLMEQEPCLERTLKKNPALVSLTSFQRKNGFWALNTLALYGSLRGRERSQATHLDLNDFNICVKSLEDIWLTQPSLDKRRALTLSGFLWLLLFWNKKKLNCERVVQQYDVALILLGIM